MQISFIIGKDKELEMMNYIENECYGRVYRADWVNNREAIKDIDSLKDSRYFFCLIEENFYITPKSYRLDLRYEKENLDGIEVIFYVPKNVLPPKINYTREKDDLEKTYTCRFQVSYPLPDEYDDAIELYRKIRDWVKAHSKKKIDIEGLKHYIVE